MAIKTGKFSMKALMEGKIKVSKDDLVGHREQVFGIVKGFSSDNGDYVYLFLDNDRYVSVPAANLDEFIEYASDKKDSDDLKEGKYDVIFDKSVSGKGRDYYTCHLEEHED